MQRVDGKYFLDVGWQAFDAGIEIHGIPHLAVLPWDLDLFRANEIAILGPRLLKFRPRTPCATRAGLAAQQTPRLLRRQGWAG